MVNTANKNAVSNAEQMTKAPFTARIKLPQSGLPRNDVKIMAEFGKIKDVAVKFLLIIGR